MIVISEANNNLVESIIQIRMYILSVKLEFCVARSTFNVIVESMTY